jgi:hypothetical protein
MKPEDFLINFILDRAACVAFILLVCMAFLGWFGFFRVRDQRDALRAENIQLEKDLKDVCGQLNELRSSIAGGWPVTF